MLREILNTFEQRYRYGLPGKHQVSETSVEQSKILKFILTEKTPSTFKYIALLNELRECASNKSSTMSKLDKMTSND